MGSTLRRRFQTGIVIIFTLIEKPNAQARNVVEGGSTQGHITDQTRLNEPQGKLKNYEC